MHWTIDAVVEAAPSNGRPKALRTQDQVIIPITFLARPARSFSLSQEMALSGAPNGGTSKYSYQAAVGLCGPFSDVLKIRIFLITII